MLLNFKLVQELNRTYNMTIDNMNKYIKTFYIRKEDMHDEVQVSVKSLHNQSINGGQNVISFYPRIDC